MSIAQASLNAPAAFSAAARKRSFAPEIPNEIANETAITGDFVKLCDRIYKSNPTNEILRNMITMDGADYAATSDQASRKITHQFTHSHRVHNYKTLSQSHSGRCWIFAGLNIFRPLLMKTVESKTNIKLSATYLFFWDKLERSRTYLLKVLDTLNLDDEDRRVDGMLNNPLGGDGGYFRYFLNLVDKYGIVPESAMPETALSGFSAEMNDQLETRLKTTGFQLRSNKQMSKEEQKALVQETLISIYSDLVKCLGEPPKKFEWAISDEEGEWTKIPDLNPHKFLQLCCPSRIPVNGGSVPFGIKDFVEIVHLPHLQANRLYEVQGTKNIYEGMAFRFLNVNLRDFECYTREQWRLMPVGMCCDMGKNYSAYFAAIDPELVDMNRVFDPVPSLNKTDMIRSRVLATNHAMTIIGVEIGPGGLPTHYEIENSWGHYDSDEPGQDGFLCMTQEGFRSLCTNVVVARQLLSASHQSELLSAPEMLPPWSIIASALRISGRPSASVTNKENREKLRNATRS